MVLSINCFFYLYKSVFPVRTQVWSILKLVFTLRYKPMYQNVNVLYKYNTSKFCQEYDIKVYFPLSFVLELLKDTTYSLSYSNSFTLR